MSEQRDWTDLAAYLSRSDYYAKPIDRHYGATEPLEPLPCRCEPPNVYIDHAADDEPRCWKCGSRPRPERTSAAAQVASRR